MLWSYVIWNGLWYHRRCPYDGYIQEVRLCVCIGSGSSLTVEQEIRSGKPKQSRRRQSFRQYRFDIAGRMLCGRSNSITCLR